MPRSGVQTNTQSPEIICGSPTIRVPSCEAEMPAVASRSFTSDLMKVREDYSPQALGSSFAERGCISTLPPDFSLYLDVTDLEVALLLNFKEAALTWKRVVGRNSELDRGLHLG